MTTDALPDRVVVALADGLKSYTLHEYVGLPVEQQVDLLLRGRVTFYRAAEKLPTRVALKALRATRAATSSADASP